MFSSADTRRRSKALAAEIGSYHLDTDIDCLVSSMMTLFSAVTQTQPRFKVHGGSHQENLALQNIQVYSSFE